MRRLLPYERALIDTLGITEEEYFRFIVYQEQYKDIKDGTVLDIRNGLETGTVALILSIVGTLASVGAALLAPRPQAPEIDAQAGGSRRERRFSPRFGFDSAQDLAQYGSPVNLVYTDVDTNPTGGVRVASSLLWSAVHSYGGKQFMQMLATIGSADIVSIAPDRTAFGQVPLRQFVNAGNWLYFRSGGPIRFDDLVRPTGDDSDPSRASLPSSSLAYRPYIVPAQNDADKQFDGFSQAYSPASFSSFGITSPIPINVDILERKDDGTVARPGENKITVEDRGEYWPNFYGDSRTPFPVGHRIVLRIAKVDNRGILAEKAAEQDRLVAASAIDGASIYKLGSAKFKVVSMSGSEDLNKSALLVTMQCTESGFAPEEDYNTRNTRQEENELSALLPALIAQRDALRETFNPTITIQRLTASQQGAYETFNGELDRLDDIIDDIAYVKRNLDQLDEYVIENPDLFGGKSREIAATINTSENDLEDLRDKIQDEKKKNNPDKDRIVRLRTQIQEKKVIIRLAKKKLAEMIREDNFADQRLFNYLETLQRVADSVQRQFKSFPGYEIVKDSDFSDIIANRRGRGRLGAKEERRFLKRIRRRLEKIELRISSVLQIDQAAIDTHNARVQTEINEINARIERIKNALSNAEGLNDYLATKCICKTQEASYETVSPCRVVNFAIKGRSFMRVQGRQKQYGEVKVDGYRQSDNGIKHRSAFFLMFYREITSDTWILVPRIFVLRRAADNDYFFPLYFRAPDATKRWAFRFEPIFDTASEIRKHGISEFAYVNAGQTVENISAVSVPGRGESVLFYGGTRSAAEGRLPPRNNSPFALDEWTLYPPSLVTDNNTNEGVADIIKACSSDANIAFSFDNGPEFDITAVTEQQSIADYSQQFASIYNDVSLLGFNCFSGQGVRSLRSLSAFVTRGKRVRRLSSNPDSPTCPSEPDDQSNYAPDIFLDTILDKKNGIGQYTILDKKDGIEQYADVPGVNLRYLALSKKMCIENGYFMDGVIADFSSWREFWAEVAPYSLLELARIGGQDCLIPAVPVTTTGAITSFLTISALFNQGNILEDSYREEILDYGDSTQDIIATVIYRASEKDGVFPKNSSVTLRLNDTSEANARRVTFDLSQFVTNSVQAIQYGMLMCQQRRHVRRAIEFKTFPTEAPVEPGSYIFVQTDENKWDNIKSGIVEPGGSLNAPVSEPISGSFNALLYDGASAVVSIPSVSVTNNVAPALSNYSGNLFVLGVPSSHKRVFRVSEVELDEQGEVTIRATEHPCRIVDGNRVQSLIARFSRALFTIQE